MIEHIEEGCTLYVDTTMSRVFLIKSDVKDARIIIKQPIPESERIVVVGKGRIGVLSIKVLNCGNSPLPNLLYEINNRVDVIYAPTVNLHILSDENLTYSYITSHASSSYIKYRNFYLFKGKPYSIACGSDDIPYAYINFEKDSIPDELSNFLKRTMVDMI